MELIKSIDEKMGDIYDEIKQLHSTIDSTRYGEDVDMKILFMGNVAQNDFMKMRETLDDKTYTEVIEKHEKDYTTDFINTFLQINRNYKAGKISEVDLEHIVDSVSNINDKILEVLEEAKRL